MTSFISHFKTPSPFILFLCLSFLLLAPFSTLAQEEVPSKDNLWNKNYCHTNHTRELYKPNVFDFVKNNNDDLNYRTNEDYLYELDYFFFADTFKVGVKDEHVFSSQNPFVITPYSSTFSVKCNQNNEASDFEVWFMVTPPGDGWELFAHVDPKNWELTLYNDKYIDTGYDPKDDFRPDYSYGTPLTFDMIIQRTVPSSENPDNGRVDTILRNFTLEPEEEMKFKIHNDPNGGITILEGNFEEKVQSEFRRSVRSHAHAVQYPEFEINPNMSQIVLQPDVPRFSQLPKMNISFNEKQEDGSIQKVEKVIEGVNEIEPDRIITYIDLNPVFSKLSEEAGRIQVNTEVLGDPQFVPKDLELKFYINDHFQKTIQWNKETGTSLLLNGLPKGEHEIKMENVSQSNGGLIWTTQETITLTKDHSNELYFEDIPPLHELYDEILTSVKQGWINGYPDLTFKPDHPVNRAEFAKMLTLAFHKKEGTGDNLKKFPDVDLTQWYKPYLSRAVDLNMMQGYPDGTMKPGNTINKAEALKMTLELIQKKEEVSEDSPWYEKYRLYAVKNLTLPFLSEDQMNKDMTRGECVQLILEAIRENR